MTDKEGNNVRDILKNDGFIGEKRKSFGGGSPVVVGEPLLLPVLVTPPKSGSYVCHAFADFSRQIRKTLTS